MRLSQLAASASVSIPTVKYYLREGLLPPGVRKSATDAEYSEEHVRRLRLIRALREVVGMPVEKIAQVLAAIDDTEADSYARLGRAIGALSDAPTADDYPRARAALEALNMVYDPAFPAVAQLDAALQAAESVGVAVTPTRLKLYARHVRAMAAFDIQHLPAGSLDDVEYAVLGTALHEPVLAALRRLEHQDLLAESRGG